jgi:hypothetical protein
LFGSLDAEPYYYIAVVLVAAALGILAFFGVTQESATDYAMRGGRAAVCAAVGSMGIIGAGLVATVIFNGMEVTSVLIIGLALFIPAMSIGVFLGATGSDRRKPWVKEYMECGIHAGIIVDDDVDVDPVKAARFGVASGGLWLMVIAIFVALIFLTDWQYSWLVFLFAIPIQVVMVAMIFDKRMFENIDR